MREAGAPSTGVGGHAFRGVRDPPGVVMVAPPMLPRTAEGAHKAKAALVEDGPLQRGQQYNHYKDQSPVAPTRSNNLRPR